MLWSLLQSARAGKNRDWGRMATAMMAKKILSHLGWATAFAAMLLLGLRPFVANAASGPYSHVPTAGDQVRFDGSAGGETKAWAYPNAPSLEAYLRSTIDASFGSTSYSDYERKMGSVLARSLQVVNGTPATVQGVSQFNYRGHDDVEVQLRITSGPLARAVVWTTPAELVTSTGHRYLK